MLKTTVLALSAVAALSTGAGALAQTAAPPAGFDPAATEFSGWVVVTGGEFKLYQTENQMRGAGFQCVSGALPRDLQRASHDISGQRVRFTGRTLAWSEHGTAPRYDWRGSKIENLCGRNVVILADNVTVTG